MRLHIKNILLHSFILLILMMNIVQASTTKYYEEIFATSVMLADSDSISLGMGNFDPDVLLKPNQSHLIDNASDSQSIQTRNQLSIINIPYTFVLDSENETLSDKITLNASYIKQDKSHSALDDTALIPDDNLDKTYSAYFAYSKYASLSNRWTLRYRLGSYFMRYKNRHQYNNELSKTLQPQIDGVYYNTSANSVIIEPNVKLTYTSEKSWGKWQLSSDVNYFKGKVYSGAAASLNSKPTGWRVNNGMKVHFDVNTSKIHTESLYLKLARVDIKGDMVSSLETDHFYEIGFGVLLDTSKFTDLANNVGIGINLNKGSSLYGGSIVFYFNEF